MGFRVPLEKLAPVTDRDEDDRHPWWEGRQVVIRPDVPGSGFDTGDLILIESDEERVEMNIRIDAAVAEDAEGEPWPEWLAPQPEVDEE